MTLNKAGDPVRIAFVSDNAFPWFNGGIERRRFIIMHRLAMQGNDVHCFTMFRDGMRSKDFKFEGINYHCVREASGWQGMYTNTGKRRSIRMPLVFAIAMFFKILPYRFDMVDADSFPFLHIPPLYLYTRLRRMRLVVTWHEVWSRGFWLSYSRKIGTIGYIVEKLCAIVPDMHISNASTTKRLLWREFRVDPKKVVVFPAAVDGAEISRFLAANRWPARKNKFIVINRLVRHKRVGLAIEAIAKTNAKLVVVGTGPELDKLEKLAREKARGKVTFMHGLSTRRLYTEICESKALVMPSEREGLSLVALEALALGTPVVVMDTSSLPREVRKYCIEVKEGRLGSALDAISKGYGRYAAKYERTRGAVVKEFSGDKAQQVYSGIMEKLRGTARS